MAPDVPHRHATRSWPKTLGNRLYGSLSRTFGITLAMSFAAGQALAYLKIGVIAFAVMAAVWAVVKVVEARGRRKNDGGDGRDGC